MRARGLHDTRPALDGLLPDVIQVSRRLHAAGYPLLLDARERTYRIGRQGLTVRQLLVADPDGYLIRPSQVVARSPAGTPSRA